MKPNYVQFRIGLDEFSQQFKTFMKEQKGWVVECEFDFEGPEDQGRLGDLYFDIDLGNLARILPNSIGEMNRSFFLFSTICNLILIITVYLFY